MRWRTDRSGQRAYNCPCEEGRRYMQHQRRSRRYGAATYLAWASVLAVIVMLGGFSLFGS
jgi:hypothetical protein